MIDARLVIIISGTCAYKQLNNILANTRILNNVKKLSPEAQTSCLEGFHSTLNHWHPKMIGFSWLGTYSRLTNISLISLHAFTESTALLCISFSAPMKI